MNLLTIKEFVYIYFFKKKKKQKKIIRSYIYKFKKKTPFLIFEKYFKTFGISNFTYKVVRSSYKCVKSCQHYIPFLITVYVEIIKICDICFIEIIEQEALSII